MRLRTACPVCHCVCLCLFFFLSFSIYFAFVFFFYSFKTYEIRQKLIAHTRKQFGIFALPHLELYLWQNTNTWEDAMKSMRCDLIVMPLFVAFYNILWTIKFLNFIGIYTDRIASAIQYTTILIHSIQCKYYVYFNAYSSSNTQPIL